MADKIAHYFRHDADASSDLKLEALRKKYGWEGQGWYWFIVERLNSATEYQLTYSELTFEGISLRLQVETEKVKQFIDDCIEKFKDEHSSLFSKNGNYFYSKRLNRDMERLEEARRRNVNAGQASALARGYKLKGQELSPKQAEFIKIYESMVGVATPNNLEKLKDMSETYSVDAWRKVVTETPPEKRNIPYMEKVLESSIDKPEQTPKPTGMKVKE